MCTWLAQSWCFIYLGVQQPQSQCCQKWELVFEGWRLEIWKRWSVRREAAAGREEGSVAGAWPDRSQAADKAQEYSLGLQELQDLGANRITAVCLKACWLWGGWILESKTTTVQVGCRVMAKPRDKCGSVVRGCETGYIVPKIFIPYHYLSPGGSNKNDTSP